MDIRYVPANNGKPTVLPQHVCYPGCLVDNGAPASLAQGWGTKNTENQAPTADPVATIRWNPGCLVDNGVSSSLPRGGRKPERTLPYVGGWGGLAAGGGGQASSCVCFVFVVLSLVARVFFLVCYLFSVFLFGFVLLCVLCLIVFV